MAIEWHKTQFPGVRFRENSTKKHNGKPDRYFTIRYKLSGVLKEEGLGWSSQGWNAQKASITRNELIKGHRTGEGPATLAEKRKVAEEKKSFEAVHTGKKIVAISRTYAKTVKEIGLNKGITDRRMKVVFHTLRHTYASWLVEKGVDLYTVKELIGHSSLAMTERYSHVGENAKTVAIRKLEKIDLDLNQVHQETR